MVAIYTVVLALTALTAPIFALPPPQLDLVAAAAAAAARPPNPNNRFRPATPPFLPPSGARPESVPGPGSLIRSGSSGYSRPSTPLINLDSARPLSPYIDFTNLRSVSPCSVGSNGRPDTPTSCDGTDSRAPTPPVVADIVDASFARDHQTPLSMGLRYKKKISSRGAAMNASTLLQNKECPAQKFAFNGALSFPRAVQKCAEAAARAPPGDKKCGQHWSFTLESRATGYTCTSYKFANEDAKLNTVDDSVIESYFYTLVHYIQQPNCNPEPCKIQ